MSRLSSGGSCVISGLLALAFARRRDFRGDEDKGMLDDGDEALCCCCSFRFRFLGGEESGFGFEPGDSGSVR